MTITPFLCSCYRPGTQIPEQMSSQSGAAWAGKQGGVGSRDKDFTPSSRCLKLILISSLKYSTCSLPGTMWAQGRQMSKTLAALQMLTVKGERVKK